jgi:hypothetical protein
MQKYRKKEIGKEITIGGIIREHTKRTGSKCVRIQHVSVDPADYKGLPVFKGFKSGEERGKL